MKPKPFPLGPIVFVIGLVIGLSGGCSKQGSTNVDLKRAKAALVKRTADYGEVPRSQPRERDKAPAKSR